MGEKAKQAALYMGLLLVCVTYTLISPFFPHIAKSKGVPFWLIGVIFSLNPFSSLLTSLFLGKYMMQIGRKLIIFISFLLTSASLIILSPIQDCEKNTLIVLSIFSRLIGGMGAGCIFTSITTVFISDYPESLQKMIGRMEASIGIGLILGPLIGIVLYLIDLLAALLIVGGIILISAPIAWKMLGEFRIYQILNVDFNRLELFLKPVKNI